VGGQIFQPEGKKMQSRKMTARLTAISVLGILFSVAHASASEGLKDGALEDHLIAHSPWSGTWDTPGCCNGEVEYVFDRVDGKFSAKITRATGGPAAGKALGRVSDLKVKGREITFRSSAGTQHEFKVDEKTGKIEGSGTTGTGRGGRGRPTYTTLEPTTK